MVMRTAAILLLLQLALGAPALANAQNAPSRAAPDATLHHDASATTALGSAQPLHDHRVSLRFRDAPLGDALAEIAARARLHLIYSPDLIPADRRVSLTLEDVPALEAMRRVLAGQGIRMLTSRNAVVLVPGEAVERPAPARQGTGEIVGRVTDAATGAVISAVSIVVEGTNRGALSDAGGRYRIAGVPAGKQRVSAVSIWLDEHVGQGAGARRGHPAP